MTAKHTRDRCPYRSPPVPKLRSRRGYRPRPGLLRPRHTLRAGASHQPLHRTWHQSPVHGERRIRTSDGVDLTELAADALAKHPEVWGNAHPPDMDVEGASISRPTDGWANSHSDLLTLDNLVAAGR